jgi:hypothetical protein
VIRATLAQTNYFVLQKNLLLADKSPGVIDFVRHMVGLPAVEPATPFLVALARRPGFSAKALMAELYHDRKLIKAPLMRHTDYVVDASQFAEFFAATTRQRNQGFNAEFRQWGIESNDEIENLGTTILNVIGDQPLTVEALKARVPADLVRELTQTSRGGRVTTTDNVRLALRWLVGRGALGVSNRATDWHEERLTYARFAHLYPGLHLAETPGEAAAQKWLVRAYLATFGPATEADISFWTGFGKSETARAIAALSGETSLAMVDGLPGMLLMLKSQTGALSASSAFPEPVVNILPADDPLTSAHRASRSRYVGDPKLQRLIFDRAGRSRPTILLNGQVVGLWAWRLEDGQAGIDWQLLAELDSTREGQIQAELETMGHLIQPRAQLRRSRN